MQLTCLVNNNGLNVEFDMLNVNKTSVSYRTNQLQELFNNYANMLYGYIFAVVENHEEAENYLIKIFSELSEELESVSFDEINSWWYVSQYAIKKNYGN